MERIYRQFIGSFFFLRQKERKNVMNSARGIASQTPFTPRTAGSVSSAITVKTKVLEKEISAELSPSDSAVNSPEE